MTTESWGFEVGIGGLWDWGWGCGYSPHLELRLLLTTIATLDQS